MSNYYPLDLRWIGGPVLIIIETTDLASGIFFAQRDAGGATVFDRCP